MSTAEAARSSATPAMTKQILATSGHAGICVKSTPVPRRALPLDP
jgi:hypothetical protein